ncbi:TPA: hypothetical protein U1C34_000796 [Streptococcus suis]|uniref:hypothetical protein n=1 Tax=Streptococcus suis TaxID=1307 RepID=UPI00240DBF9B|nr:hypothetical protein [Streptococcus suis]WFA75371.1 hypothetical protein PFZ59_09410 [Streptococcus suis]HEM3611582.1 hypothetical protein [Streptococcus suis]HEM3622026.1 hypothetical protein [Streptococcus suis]HEM3626456.1 hypothetical protein [Streptococcus suis]HEM3631001.1 hypothetical protein [Streptococcus suis]
MAKMLSQRDWDYNKIGTRFELDEVMPKYDTETRTDDDGNIILGQDGKPRKFNTDKIIGYKYNVTIKDGQFKKKSTQVTIEHTKPLVDNDYIMEADEVVVAFDNLEVSMAGNVMYYKADDIHLLDK